LLVKPERVSKGLVSQLQLQVGKARIPRILLGTSPFVGAGQFGSRAQFYYNHFYQKPGNIVKLVLKAVDLGVTGIQALPFRPIFRALKAVERELKGSLNVVGTIGPDDPVSNIQDFQAFNTVAMLLHGEITDKRNSREISELLNKVHAAGCLAGLVKQAKNSINKPNLLPFAWNLKQNGQAEPTIETAINRLRHFSELCNINEPEQVKATLASQQWKNTTKHNFAVIYSSYLKFIGKTWERPKYKIQHELPFIPTEQEIDSLISAGTPKTSAILQLLKETGARVSEIARLKKTDIDLERKTVTITASKGSNSRILPISNKLIAMLDHMNNVQHFQHTERLFKQNQHNIKNTFEHLRKRTAVKLNNPRLMKIHLHTFRHFKATIEYHKTKDIIHVKTVLGHRNIENTMIYINLEQAIFLTTSDDYTCKTAKDVNEATQLTENGFEYTATTPDGYMIYRKRK